jgi:Tol biopolymer transport system component
VGLTLGMSYWHKASATVPYVNERVDTDSGGNQSTGGVSDTATGPAISQDGRYVAFATGSSNLVSGDTNGVSDVFVKDRQTGAIVRANTSSTGAQMPGTGGLSSGLQMSDNGRFVAFEAVHPGLVSGYSNTYKDIYVKDLQTGSIEIDSVSSAGSYGNANAAQFDLSADGRYLVFGSNASNLVANDTNGQPDIFVRDRLLNTTTLLSQAPGGTIANDGSLAPTISCDGAYVAFTSSASNLVSNDVNGAADVFLVDRVGGRTIDITFNGNATPNAANSRFPQLSCDGSTLLFYSAASNLVSNDTNGSIDIFTYDIYSGAMDRVNVSSSGTQSTRDANADYSSGALSYDGRYVVFSSYDASLASGDTNGATSDILIRDRRNGTTDILSKRTASTATTSTSFLPSISSSGKYAAYASDDTGLVSGDTNGNYDVFISQTGI